MHGQSCWIMCLPTPRQFHHAGGEVEHFGGGEALDATWPYCNRQWWSGLDMEGGNDEGDSAHERGRD